MGMIVYLVFPQEDRSRPPIAERVKIGYLYVVTCEIRFEDEWGPNYTILDTEGRFYDAFEGVGGSPNNFSCS